MTKTHLNSFGRAMCETQNPKRLVYTEILVTCKKCQKEILEVQRVCTAREIEILNELIKKFALDKENAQ